MLRLTGGIHRGRPLLTPSHDRTRPTQAKLRQALFNSIQGHLEGSRVLDLFAGSGSLGFEALSRGASKVVFVESLASVSKLIRQNSEMLKVQNQVHVFSESVHTALKKVALLGPYHLIFADPPYADGWESKLFELLPWDTLLNDQGYFFLEWGLKQAQTDALPDRVPFLVKVREKNYGDTVLTSYQRCQS
jgi:16S rRNA (guanine966-N2)-methyltransferase